MIKVLLKIVSSGYFIALISLTFFLSRRKGDHNYRARANFTPFKKIFYFDTVNSQVMPGFILEILGNLLLFFPFMWALYFLTERKTNNFIAILIVFFTTLTIETMQYVFSVGVFDVDDIFFNIIGGLLGQLILVHIKEI